MNRNRKNAWSIMAVSLSLITIASVQIWRSWHKAPIVSAPIAAKGQLENKVFKITVERIKDGDTFAATNEQNEALNIRIACIDALELKQPGGTAAQARLKELLPLDSSIMINQVSKDLYGRVIAEVYTPKKGESNLNSSSALDAQSNVGLILVKEGQAIVYNQYLEQCKNKQELLTAQKEAKDQRQNYWSQENPVAPWDYRQSRLKKTKTILQTAD
jgi:micrococcal nuclease